MSERMSDERLVEIPTLESNYVPLADVIRDVIRTELADLRGGETMTDFEWPTDGEIDAVFRLEVDRAWGIPVKSIPYPIVCGARFAIRHFLKEAAIRKGDAKENAT